MIIDNNKQWVDNPRKISDKQLVDLQTHLEELGDLSGVVYCENMKAYVGGNQRSKVFDGATITITEKLDKPSKTGTIAYGFIEYKGEKYTYRAVKFSEENFKKACIVANSAGGEWDMDKLSSWDKEELSEWGIEEVMENTDEVTKKFTKETIALKPFFTNHILISYPLDKVTEIQDIVSKLYDIEGIELEQASN